MCEKSVDLHFYTESSAYLDESSKQHSMGLHHVSWRCVNWCHVTLHTSKPPLSSPSVSFLTLSFDVGYLFSTTVLKESMIHSPPPFHTSSLPWHGLFLCFVVFSLFLCNWAITLSPPHPPPPNIFSFSSSCCTDWRHLLLVFGKAQPMWFV